MIDLYVELKALLQALDTAGIPYALCGGLALMVYQRPRATVDIDLILPAEVTGKVEEGGPDVLMLASSPLTRSSLRPGVAACGSPSEKDLINQHPDAFPGSDNACP